MKPEVIIDFMCNTCGGHPVFSDTATFRDHLKTVHYMLPGTQGVRTMNFHLDTATHYTSGYDLVYGGLPFSMWVKTERESAFHLRKLQHERLGLSKQTPRP